MSHTVSPKALAVIRKMQQGELTESVIYERIAQFAKGEENKATLLRLAGEEKAHYEIWKTYTGEEMKPEMGKVFKYTMIARILGFTFAVKLMERGEEMPRWNMNCWPGKWKKVLTSARRRKNMSRRC